MNQVALSTALSLGLAVALFGALALVFKQRAIIARQRERLNLFHLIADHLQDLLTGISWNADLLAKEEFGKLKISQIQILDKVTTEAKDALRLVQKFIGYTSKNRSRSFNANDKANAEKLMEKELTGTS